MKTKNLNTYKVTSVHDVYTTSYENGDENYINSYSLSSEIEAPNWRGAIEKYFSDYLFYKLDFDYSFIEEDYNTFHYSSLVDADNIEVNEREIEQWKENKLTLYSNVIVLSVYQISSINLK